MTLRDQLRGRAERGTPRGADLVWAAATGRTEVRRPRRWLVPAAAAAVAAAVVLPVLLVQGDGADRAPTVDAPTSAAPAPSTHDPLPDPTDSPAPTGQEDLDRIAELSDAYRKCATRPGSGPLPVQVIVNAAGKPIHVKAGYDVPAEIHRVCLMEIGGDDPLSSSYGNPSRLGECWGVDRTPPIDSDPAPAGTIDPATVLGPVADPVRAGYAPTLTWSVSGLQVPRDLVVECWNGQAWVAAYVARWLREGMPPVTAEFDMGAEVVVRNATRPVDGRSLSLPVPGNAPPATYRVVAEAAQCSEDDGCAPVPFEVEFTVRR